MKLLYKKEKWKAATLGDLEIQITNLQTVEKRNDQVTTLNQKVANSELK